MCLGFVNVRYYLLSQWGEKSFIVLSIGPRYLALPSMLYTHALGGVREPKGNFCVSAALIRSVASASSKLFKDAAKTSFGVQPVMRQRR